MTKEEYDSIQLTFKRYPDAYALYINDEYIGYVYPPLSNMRHFSIMFIKAGDYIGHCVEWCINMWPGYPEVTWEDYDN